MFYSYLTFLNNKRFDDKIPEKLADVYDEEAINIEEFDTEHYSRYNTGSGADSESIKNYLAEAIQIYPNPVNNGTLNIVSPTKSPDFDDYVQTFYELRKHKNVNLEMARDTMADVSYFGTMMIYGKIVPNIWFR